MAKIEIEDGTLSIDATVIAEGLGIGAAEVQALMREGRITSICERGIDDDAGRYRLTFFFGNRGFRVVADESGQIIGPARGPVQRERSGG